MWAQECWSYTLARKAPDACLDVCLAFLELDPTDEELAFFAAGPLENLLHDNGAAAIGRIEREARHNFRFRLMLSGVWGANTIKSPLWRRIQAAVEPGPHMDDDPRTPQGSTRPRE
ncbi:MAG: DUF6869 domain-containing protein [Pseudomonadota bacterium]